jgi:hypothetical protein
MRVTIIRDDNVVGVDGVFRLVDLSGMPAGIRAMQWDGTQGHREYYDGAIANTSIVSIASIQSFIDLWTAAAPSPPPEPTPQELIASAHARINRAYEAAVNALTVGYPDTEIASWPKQEGEARAFLADNNAATPWIDGAAASRGLTKAQLVALIIGNADALAPLHGGLTGKRQSLRDAIDALGEAPTQEQLDAIQW